MSKIIPLSQNKVAIIDDCDFDMVMTSGYRWYANYHGYTWYALGWKWDHNHKQVIMPMHRLIMGASDGQFIDHADRNGLNNRRDNLRFATPGQNRANTKIHRNNKSGFKGVYYRSYRGKFEAQLRVNGKKIYLGRFDDPIEAAKAYDEAALKYYGSFACINGV